MNPGEFRHKVEIVTISASQQSDYGDMKETEINSYDKFCKIKWLPGSEKIEAETISLQKNIEFIFRYESITNQIDRIDYIEYNSDKYYASSILFKGHANQQYVIIKASTFTD